MTSDLSGRLALYDDLLRRLAAAVRAAQLYAADHPLLGRSQESLLATLQSLHHHHPSIVIGIVGQTLVVSDTPMTRASAGLTELIRRLRDHEIERIAIDRGITRDEVDGFVHAVATLGSRTGDRPLQSAHVHVGRLRAREERADGVDSDMEAIRALYASTVTAAEVLWESARTEGVPELPVALHAVDGLAETVSENRTALVALTAMHQYDNYTFTHMVNVAILTMGQARALGIEGRLLREFGLSALMHDIGKVRTPKDILNKPDALTDDEFAIMRRHTVEGAELLRRIPDMPILAPVVAFEHHLRLDGTGYPFGVRRDSLNLATMLCSIADVYDAMRSQRTYQRAFPTERILAVLKRNDGTQFDQHLIRRFVQLLGIYPPGNMVRLADGEIAVVIAVHAPDPYRPRVRILFDRAGARLSAPVDRNLWEAPADGGHADRILEPVDPAVCGVDPLTFLPTRARTDG